MGDDAEVGAGHDAEAALEAVWGKKIKIKIKKGQKNKHTHRVRTGVRI